MAKNSKAIPQHKAMAMGLKPAAKPGKSTKSK